MIRYKITLVFVLMGFIVTAQDSLRYKPHDEVKMKGVEGAREEN